MAAVTASANAYNTLQYGNEILQLPAGETIKSGWLVGISPTTGKITKAGGAGVITLGRAEIDAEADENVLIRRGAFGYPADTGLTLDGKLIGKVAYAQHQNSVTTTSSANARPAGIVLGVIDGGLIIDTTMAPALPTPTA